MDANTKLKLIEDHAKLYYGTRYYFTDKGFVVYSREDKTLNIHDLYSDESPKSIRSIINFLTLYADTYKIEDVLCEVRNDNPNFIKMYRLLVNNDFTDISADLEMTYFYRRL